MPNPPMITADAMLSHRTARGVIRVRSPATTPVRIAHQATEPQNTRATTAAAPAGPPVPAPMLANSAAVLRPKTLQ